MEDRSNYGKMLGSNVKLACICLGIRPSRFCYEMDRIMQETAEQGKKELVLNEMTLKKYLYVGFPQAYYLDAYSEFICIFEKAITEISVDFSAVGRNWEKYKEGILKSFDEIHDRAANHFANPE